MTHQYKQKQETLMGKITELDNQIKAKDDKIKQLNENIESINEKNRSDLNQKENEIQELKKKINDMSTEFSNMLKVASSDFRKPLKRWSKGSTWLNGTKKITKTFLERSTTMQTTTNNFYLNNCSMLFN